MASTGGYHHFEVLEGHSDILECVYCTGLLKDAKELPCGHLICEVCLQTLNQTRLAFIHIISPNPLWYHKQLTWHTGYTCFL